MPRARPACLACPPPRYMRQFATLGSLLPARDARTHSALLYARSAALRRAALPPCIQAITLAAQAASGHSKPATHYAASADPALPVRRMPTRRTPALPRSSATFLFHIPITHSQRKPPPFAARRQGCPRNPALPRRFVSCPCGDHTRAMLLPCMLPSLHSHPARALPF